LSTDVRARIELVKRGSAVDETLPWERAPDDAIFARRWHALRDQIEQHMDEEERELFPLAARLLAAEMQEITAAMQEIQAPILVS
jgi:hemerythrin-like domain-containing protein